MRKEKAVVERRETHNNGSKKRREELSHTIITVISLLKY